MATQKFKAVAELFLDTRDAENDAKQFVQDVKKQLKDLENAVDKVTVFKDFVGYIAQIDKNLSELKAKNADTFKHMFDGLDGNMRQMLESLFGVSGDQLGQVDALRTKLATLTPKSTVKDIKAFAGEINQLFRVMGKESPIALQDITASTKADTIKQMTQALENFAVVWRDVNKKVVGGFAFGGTGGGSGSGGGSSISAEVQAEIDKITTQIDELKRAKEELQKVAKLQSTIKSKGSSAIPDSIEAYTTTEAVQGLITEFDSLEKELSSGDKASADYANKLIKMSNIILTLQKSLKAVRADNTIKDLFQAVGSGQGDSMLGALSKYVNNKSLKHVNEIISLDTIPQMDAKILGLENEANYLARPYDTLNEKLHEYVRLQEQMDSASGENLRSLYTQSDAVREYIIALGEAKKKTQEVEDVFDNLFADDDGLFAESDINNALKQLCNILGVQLPGAVNKAKDAFTPETQSGKTSDGSGGAFGGGTGAGSADTDWSSLEGTITTETGKIIQKLGETLKVEIVKDSARDKEPIDKLSSLLKDAANASNAHHLEVLGGKASPKETMSFYGVSGSIAEFQGEGLAVETKTIVENLINNLKENIIMALHTHPDGMKAFTLSDVKSFADLMYDQGVKMNGIIVGNTVKTIDFTGISKIVVEKIVQSFSDGLADFASNSKGWYKFNGRDIGISQAMQDKIKNGEAAKFGVSSEFLAAGLESAVNDILNKAFKDNGVTPAIKEFALDQLPELSQQIVAMGNAGANAIDPIEKLKALITTLSQGKITDFAQFADILNKFSAGSLSGAQAIEKILHFEPGISQLQQKTEIDSTNLEGAISELAGKVEGFTNQLGTIAKQVAESGVPVSNLDAESNVTGSPQTTQGIIPDSTADEIRQLGLLKTTLAAVEQAVRDKTQAFRDEGIVVQETVNSEIVALSELLRALGFVKAAVENVENAFVYQGADVGGGLPPSSSTGTGATDTIENTNVALPDFALDETVGEINRVLGEIFGALTSGSAFSGLVDPLKNAVDALQKVSNGIIEEHKRKKVDTSVADARLADSAEVANIQQAALDAVSGRMMSGGKSAVTGMTAMKDGVVKVTGWIQTATDAWEGFTVQVNEANQASKTAYDLSAKAAKMATAQEKEDNPYEYDKAEVEARARKHLDEYTAGGKKATVQFKDSGRYTITVLEEIDGLSKQIFQTFDENDAKIERTTATMSNAQKIKLEDLKKTIDAGVNNSHVGNEDTIYKQYKTASDELERMNALYQTRDNLSGEEILNWNTQIKLVQQLGSSVESLINKRKVAANSDLFKSERGKKLSKFDLDKAELVADINIPDSFSEQLENARKNIESAVDDESLKIAINEWEALKNQIKQTATEQDLYIKKTKEAKNTQTPAEKVAKDLEKSRKLAPANALMAQVNEEMRKAGVNPNARDLTGDSAEIKKIYDDLIAKVNEYRINVQNEQQAELSGIEATKQALYQKIDTYKTVNHITDARKATFGATTTARIVDKYEGLKNVAEKDFAGSDFIQSKLKQYTDAITALQNIQGKFNVGEKITGDQEKEFNAARDACNKYGQELNKLIATAQKSAASATKSDPLGADFVDDPDGRRRALQQYVDDTYGASAAIDKFTNENNKLFFTIDNGDGTFSRMCAQINATRSAIDVTTTSTKKATGAFESFFNELKGKFKSIGAYLMASFSFQEVFQQLRKGVQYVREIDSALTELKKVTDETDTAYDKFLQSMSKTAGVVGSTVSDLTTMAAEWARLGYSIEEAGKLAESTAILLNVSEFSNATEASEALISTMQAFQYTADESQHVVDVLNEVGNNFAVSSDGIATALQDSASALMEGGNSLEQAVALIAAANKVVDFVPRYYSNMITSSGLKRGNSRDGQSRG